MPLPNKSRYTIAEAAKFIKSATGEAVTQAQILDWGTQGLYKLHIAIEHCNIRPIGETEIIQVRESITELRLNGGQAAILGRGERVGISACWHNGIACNFVRSSTYDSSWKPDTVYFGAAALVVIGAELAAFTASIAKPPQKAPATDAAKPAPEVTDQTEAVEPASDGPAKPAAPAWSLKRPERFQGYGKPLYDLLKAVHAAGQPKPSARDVLDRWKEKPPPDVAEVTDNGLKYYDAQGNTKPADLEAIRKAIGRMTKRAPDCRTLEPVSARLSRLHREINP